MWVKISLEEAYEKAILAVYPGAAVYIYHDTGSAVLHEVSDVELEDETPEVDPDELTDEQIEAIGDRQARSDAWHNRRHARMDAKNAVMFAQSKAGEEADEKIGEIMESTYAEVAASFAPRRARRTRK